MKPISIFITAFIRVIYFVSLTALLISYIAPYISPASFWPLAFFGLAYPYLLIVNIIFLIWWVIRWKKFCWLSLICILLGWNNMKRLYHIGEYQETKGNFRIISYNVKAFDFYNWPQNPGARHNFYSFIKNTPADIYCFQEFFNSDFPQYTTLDSILKLTRCKDYHILYTLTRMKKKYWGIATFSKYPIVNRGTIHFEKTSNNICIYSDITIGKDTLRIYNVHFQSNKLGYTDYKFEREKNVNTDTIYINDMKAASKNILKRLKVGFIKRASQTQLVLDHIATCKYPVIICGDFNDTPFSYTYHSFSKKLNDSFMESGNGMGLTYIGNFPSYRIDYMFHSNNIYSSNFEVLPDKLSDHYPISGHFWFKPSGQP